MTKRKLVNYLCIANMTLTANAVDVQTFDGVHAEGVSWLFVPLVSSDPKLGTSLGAMGSYMHNFDVASPVSLFGIGGVYTSTSSTVLAAFARTYFDENRQRLNVFAVGEKINNDYDNFNNTGYSVQSQGEIYGVFVRDLYGISDYWFIGAQGAATNYVIVAEDAMSEVILDQMGLTGFDSNGLGLVVNYDSRNNVNTPSSGIYAIANNIAFRKALGGSENFDIYGLTFKQYLPFGKANVFAWKFENQWTSDAPTSAYASVNLRGYTRGQVYRT